MSIKAEVIEDAVSRLFSKQLNKGFKLEAIHNYTDADEKILYHRVRLKNQATGEKIIRPLKYEGNTYVFGEPKFNNKKPLTFINEYLSNKTDRFSPDTDDDLDFLRELYRNGHISIAPFSNPDTLTLAENNNLSFYPKSVKWLLPLPEKQTFKEFTILLETKLASTDYLETNYDEVIEFCKDISLRECLAYLKYKMDEHKLPFTPGEKTRLVLAKALEEYSVAQIYGFIWSAVNNTAAYYMRSGPHR